jgi:tetraacyldisaccharide 4'-kinase
MPSLTGKNAQPAQGSVPQAPNRHGILTALPAAVYYAVQRAWEAAFKWGIKKSRRSPIPVISVGNLLMGGSGKTPFVLFMAALLRDRGMRPVVVSRGYRGTYREPFAVVSEGIPDGHIADQAEVGDEPFMIAERLLNVPVVVGRERIRAIEAACRLFHSSVAVLDDGFQHLQLQRDLDIVLLTGREDRMFPMGNLREPFTALRRCQVAVVPEGAEIPLAARAHLGGVPIFRSRVVPLSVETAGSPGVSVSPGVFRGRSVALVSGIAHPQRFMDTAANLGWNIVEHRRFRDHHRFENAELRSLLASCPDVPLIFTEKDWVRLPGWVKEKPQTGVLRIGIALDDVEAFWDEVRKRVTSVDH